MYGFTQTEKKAKETIHSTTVNKNRGAKSDQTTGEVVLINRETALDKTISLIPSLIPSFWRVRHAIMKGWKVKDATETA